MKFKNCRTEKYNVFYIYIIVSIVLFSCEKKEIKLVDTNISFTKISHDFGEIASKQYVYTSFTFKNNGDHVLLIEDIKSSCGCTVPEWTQEKIIAGKQGEIKVRYNANHPGRFNKTISVFYNGEDSPKKLIIKGQVAYPKGLEKDIVNK